MTGWAKREIGRVSSLTARPISALMPQRAAESPVLLDQEQRFERDSERLFGVKLDRGVVREHQGEPLRSWEDADNLRRVIEEMLGEKGEVVEVLL